MGEDRRLQQVTARLFELAEGELEGIDAGARELAALCAHDASVLNEARKEVARRRAAEGASPILLQAGSLLRRAIELGEWRSGFIDTGEVP